MRIIVIDKAEIQKFPPVLSVLYLLSDLGYPVTLISGGATPEIQKQLRLRKIDFHLWPSPKRTGDVNKVLSYFRFHSYTCNILSELKEQTNDELLLWVAGAHTCLSLGSLIRRFRYVLQIHELHETSMVMRKAVRRVIHGSEAVFMPEYNRTVLYRIWFRLSKLPVVLVNKPYFLPGQEELFSLREKYREELVRLRGRKIVIYQGYIHKERDLSNFIRAVKRLGSEYCTLLVGGDAGALKSYQAIDPELVHIDFLNAPDYLLFTSLAHIGIVTYDPYQLNTAYCAPNKLFEYCAYSLPIIGNDIPGLRLPLEIWQAGEVADESDEEAIFQALQKLEHNREKYQAGAAALFRSIDNAAIIRKTLTAINTRRGDGEVIR